MGRARVLIWSSKVPCKLSSIKHSRHHCGHGDMLFMVMMAITPAATSV